MKDIGDRMKRNYESRARFCLTRRTPVVIRVDGRTFHTFTRGFDRPFDRRIMLAMVHAAQTLFEDAQGAKLAYVQSDEISVVLTDYDTLQTDAWFDYNVAKLCSISASIVTRAFNKAIIYPDEATRYPTGAMFDARCFNIPREEVANYFLWRALDWKRNSLAMYASSFFSQNQLHGKHSSQVHEMLHEIGKNWTTDLTLQEKNGTFVYKSGKCHCQPDYEALAHLLEEEMV